MVPGGMAPEIQELKPLFDDYAPGSKRTKIRYGKYSLPKVSAQTISSLLTGEQGTINTVTMGMKKPCTECSLITMQAGLEYANGSLAEPSNGGWLHHIVMVASGAGRKDTACSMPIERFFSSGNEKTPTAFGDVIEKKVKSAFPIKPTDGFSAELELMNMIDVPLDVWITIDYEYMPGPPKPDWKIAKALWLDVTNCGISSVRVPAGKQQFKYASKPWTSTYDGEMLGVGESADPIQPHVELTGKSRWPSPRRWHQRERLPKQQCDLRLES
jgi:hypothetical protein